MKNHIYRLFSLVLLLSFSSNYYSQIPISDEGTITVTCGGAPVVLTGLDYGPDENYTITLCPDGGNAVFFLIDAETAGDTWNVLSTDVITIYDGENTSAPVLGSFNSSTAGPVIYYAATVENPSGCLTINFSTSATSAGAAGWTSQVNCGNQWQPFTVEVTTQATEIDDAGYVDICQGDTVFFTADGVFPYSDGSGYNQTNANSYFEWDLGEGTELEGFGLTEVYAVYTDQLGYPVTLYVTDTLGLIQLFEGAVRVSTTPNFGGVVNQYHDSLCLGATTTLVGGIALNNEISFGVGPEESSFINGGFLAGQTFLPDGSGVSYETTVTIDDFPVGSEIVNESDVMSICLTMEHSYVGDLDITITCPSGTVVSLVDQSGGSTNLGIPWATAPVDGESANNTPGVGFEYCWRPDAEFGTFADEAGANNTTFISGDGPGTYDDTQLLEGSYLPEESLAAFIGCPINGDWTITVTDNIGADNGYIFSWGVQFDPLIDPNAETYQPTFVDVYWGDEPSIISNNDTVIQVQPTALGDYNYTLYVLDDFGCSYDTTVSITVVEPFTSTVLTPACDQTTEISVINTYGPGLWSYEPLAEEGGILSIQDTIINAFDPGYYTVSYTDFFCNLTQDHNVFFYPNPTATLPEDMEICEEEPITIQITDQHYLMEEPTYYWTYDDGSGPIFIGDQQGQAVQLPGTYTCLVFDSVCENQIQGSIIITNRPCVIETFNVFTPNDDGMNDVFYIQSIEEDIYDGSELLVYNRWGNLIYEKINYRNNWKMEGVNDGTYYFILKTVQGDTHTGSFTVINNDR